MEPTKDERNCSCSLSRYMTVNGTYIHNYNGGTISENINWGANATLALDFSNALPITMVWGR
jgi:hypothetical protein